MKKIEILKKNRTNFRIKFDEEIADLVIDERTEDFEVGSKVDGYLVLVHQKAFKGRVPQFKKYTFSDVKPKKQIDATFSFNIEKWRFEVHTTSALSGACKRNKMIFDGKEVCWYTSDKHIFNKVNAEMTHKHHVVFDENYSENVKKYRETEEKADKRYEENSNKSIEELEIALTDSEIESVLSDVRDYKIKLRGKWWKSDYKEYRLYEVYNGGRFGTHEHVQRQGYSEQFKSIEYIKRVCHAYDCKTIEDLSTKL